MDFSEDWKSYFATGTSSAAPIISGSSARAVLGPLAFNPIPQTLTHLFSSSFLLPPPLPLPRLSPSRFLVTSSSASPVLPSTATSIAPPSGSAFQNDLVSAFRYNRLELLKYPDANSVVLFFPTGVNSEQVGFLLLNVDGSDLRVQLDVNGDIFRAASGASYRILRISVNAVHDSGNSSDTFGYLFASTLYSVHWFIVKHNSSLERPSVVYLGCKNFKTCSVAHVCWSPYIPEESLVLLENGELFLFDLKPSLEDPNSNTSFKGTRLRVSWNGLYSSKDRVWLSCEFSWHPRVLIVACSDVVFLVDLRLDKRIVSCLMKIEMYTRVENERFLALSRAGLDSFYFIVVSNNILFLCDVKLTEPVVLRWTHRLDRPCFINVLNLSTLRSNSREDTFESASKSGFCIILGSFWNARFKIFCYGSQKGSIVSKLSKSNKNFCAWQFPSEIQLSGRGCHCGSCLLREELSKAALPDWIDWQMKKEIVLGFGIINNDLASLLCEPEDYGGFTLIRLLSSGQLELQRYQASWVLDRRLEDCHEQVSCLDKYLLFSTGDEDYKFPKIFKFLNLNYFYAYLRGNLTELLVKNLKEPCMDAEEKESFDTEVHEFLCEKLNVCGVGPFRSSLAITAFFKDVKLPASLHEVALRKLWTELPLDLLQLAFSNYSELLDIDVDQKGLALEFLVVPDLPQLPPFFLRKSSPRSNKWSSKVKKYHDGIVGPVLPLPILSVLHEFYNGCSDMEDGKFSLKEELDLNYKEVMKVASEISISASGSKFFDDHTVSLGDDGEQTWVNSLKPKPFLLYQLVASKCSAMDLVHGNSIYQDKIYDTLIYHVPEKKIVSNEISESAGQELFDDICPVELKFNAPIKEFEVSQPFLVRLIHSLCSISESPSFFSNLSALLQGHISRSHLLLVHSRIFRVGAHQDNLIATRLIGHYPSHISLRVLNQLQNPNIFPFNAIIRVMADEGHFSHAFYMFKNLRRRSLLPNDLTFSFLLKACFWSKHVHHVQQVHTHILKMGFLNDSFVCNGLVAVYAKGFNNLASARKVFDEIPDRSVVNCWTSLIRGYAQLGQSEEVLQLFYLMIQQNLHPQNDTMVSVLSACSNLKIPSIEKWGVMFLELLNNTHPEEIFHDSINTILVYLHGKCGRIEKSTERFYQISATGKRRLLPWNAMMNAYVQNGLCLEGLNLFRMMMEEQIITPNHVTMVSVLSACAQIGDLDLGMWVHEYIKSTGQKDIIESNRNLATTLIDMYSKCGNLERAKEVFENTVSKDVVLFNAMIMGLAINGEGEDALRLFYKMPECGLKPNAVSFLGVLCACSHCGLVERGRQIFKDMTTTVMMNSSNSPRLEHYACYIDLLARGGMLEEALEVVNCMPFKPNNFVWGALLGGCLVHSRAELAQEVSMRLVEADPHNSAGYVMLANAFASDKHWSDVSALRLEMREKGIQKQPGCSWISLDGYVHEFLVGCLSHPQIEAIYHTLNVLLKHMKVPSLSSDKL
ncbi:WD repeat and FYVE domain-containing protein 3 [Senna tora]|uniref:WD repeat and FYVE domain-containing protein 3 n=2 Tax=Senna tora TaxID=362788 RepID=A0A834W9W7_9FABA|nr:WD repeat and FYVE domain-containing protein 3 [Senna tora]